MILTVYRLGFRLSEFKNVLVLQVAGGWISLWAGATKNSKARTLAMPPCIREAVANEHEIALDTIVLIRPGAIPKTTSGKIKRSLARQMWLQNSFEPMDATQIQVEGVQS